MIESLLKENNISYYTDNTDKTPGFKFAEAEVNGVPVRIEIGKRDLENNQITFVRRDTSEKITINLNENILDKLNELFNEIQNNLFEKAKERMNSLTFTASNLTEVENILNTHPGFIKAPWCGNLDCELKMKEIKGCKSRCILENEEVHDEKCVVCGNKAKHIVMWGIQY